MKVAICICDRITWWLGSHVPSQTVSLFMAGHHPLSCLSLRELWHGLVTLEVSETPQMAIRWPPGLCSNLDPTPFLFLHFPIWWFPYFPSICPLQVPSCVLVTAMGSNINDIKPRVPSKMTHYRSCVPFVFWWLFLKPHQKLQIL